MTLLRMLSVLLLPVRAVVVVVAIRASAVAPSAAATPSANVFLLAHVKIAALIMMRETMTIASMILVLVEFKCRRTLMLRHHVASAAATLIILEVIIVLVAALGLAVHE